jgi:histidinol dehydrogenase
LAITSVAPVILLGGKYGVSCVVTGTAGTVSLQILGPDGSTFVNAASFTANGTATVDLRAGKYQVTIATATGVFASFRVFRS